MVSAWTHRSCALESVRRHIGPALSRGASEREERSTEVLRSPNFSSRDQITVSPSFVGDGAVGPGEPDPTTPSPLGRVAHLLSEGRDQVKGGLFAAARFNQPPAAYGSIPRVR